LYYNILFAKHRKPFKKNGMLRNLIVELVKKGTDMLLRDSIPDSLYTEEMMNYAYLSLENQMKGL
jgi:hypothetical protein